MPIDFQVYSDIADAGSLEALCDSLRELLQGNEGGARYAVTGHAVSDRSGEILGEWLGFLPRSAATIRAVTAPDTPDMGRSAAWILERVASFLPRLAGSSALVHNYERAWLVSHAGSLRVEKELGDWWPLPSGWIPSRLPRSADAECDEGQEVPATPASLPVAGATGSDSTMVSAVELISVGPLGGARLKARLVLLPDGLVRVVAPTRQAVEAVDRLTARVPGLRREWVSRESGQEFLEAVATAFRGTHLFASAIFSLSERSALSSFELLNSSGKS